MPQVPMILSCPHQSADLGFDVAKIQIKSDKSSDFMFFQQKSLKKLGMFGNNAYLCSVKRGIRRKDDNLYGLQRSFRAPNITSHHSQEWWLCCYLGCWGTVIQY